MESLFCEVSRKCHEQEKRKVTFRPNLGVSGNDDCSVLVICLGWPECLV